MLYFNSFPLWVTSTYRARNHFHVLFVGPLPQFIFMIDSHPPLCCKGPDWIFFDGHISAGGDISVARMTVEEAKRKAERMKGCKGFCFLGPKTIDPTEPVEIYFKRKWDNAIGKRCWTSFKLEPSSGTCEFCWKRCAKVTNWLDHIKGNL